MGQGKLESALQWSSYLKDTSSQQGALVLVPMLRLRYGISDRLSFSGSTEFRSSRADLEWTYARSEDVLFAGVALSSSYAGGDVSIGLAHTLTARLGNWEPALGIQGWLVNLRPGEVDSEFFASPPPLHSTVGLVTVGVRYQLASEISVGTQFAIPISLTGLVFRHWVLPSVSVAFGW